jgi:hypothetical protein
MNNNAAAGQAGAQVFSFVCLGFEILLFLVIIASLWKLFDKAGKPGWAAIVPFYNMYVLTCEIAGKEILWFILQFIPCVNIVVQIMVWLEVARKFGRSDGFGIGLALLSPIFLPILAFGDAEYQGGRRRRRDYDEDEEEERPRRTRVRDEEEEEERPNRRVRDEVEEDDRPRRRPRADDDDDRPRGRRRDEDEDDDRPRRRR